jgi:D-lactate dehydrogenase
MKVAVFSIKAYEQPFLERSTRKPLKLTFMSDSLSVETVSKAKGFDAISVFTNDDLPAEVLEKLASYNIKHITTRAAGYDNVDLDSAKQLGIKIANVPEYSPYAIAEHAIAMILALNRKIVQADKNIKDYDFRLDRLIGFDLHGKTAGIIGSGKIGGIVLKILHGFGCNLLAYDPYPDAELQKIGVKYVELKELLNKSDIISVHSPLNPSTKHLIDREKIAQMKDGVMIINTSRGAVLKTVDIIEGLESKKIGYLGLDVYEFEKGLFFFDHRYDAPKDQLFSHLQSFKNVLITGHQAYLTQNALQNIADTTIDNLICWSSKKASPNEVK